MLRVIVTHVLLLFGGQRCCVVLTDFAAAAVSSEPGHRGIVNCDAETFEMRAKHTGVTLLTVACLVGCFSERTLELFSVLKAEHDLFCRNLLTRSRQHTCCGPLLLLRRISLLWRWRCCWRFCGCFSDPLQLANCELQLYLCRTLDEEVELALAWLGRAICWRECTTRGNVDAELLLHLLELGYNVNANVLTMVVDAELLRNNARLRGGRGCNWGRECGGLPHCGFCVDSTTSGSFCCSCS
jgi:hypothetical protein